MCLPMDQIVTSPAAKFGMGFIKMGLVPELASTRLLADRVGFGRASDLCLSGRLVSGEEAHRIGLADRLADADDLLDTAVAVAEDVRREPGATAADDQAAPDAEHRRGDLAAVQRAEHRYLLECWASAEHAEAVKAFLEKRPPVFTR